MYVYVPVRRLIDSADLSKLEASLLEAGLPKRILRVGALSAGAGLAGWLTGLSLLLSDTNASVPVEGEAGVGVVLP
jgi:hypothetical protein